MASRLSAEQRALLDRLLEREDRAGSPAGVPRWTGDREHAPLSFGQERLHYVERLRPGSPAYQLCGALRMRGELRVDLIEQAITAMLARHEVLRTGFVEGPDGVEQVVHPPGSSSVDLPVRELPGDDVRARVAELAGTGFDLTRPPLLRAELVRVGDALGPEWVLLLCVHHIVVDGWSLGLLVAELAEVYRALAEGDRPRLPELEVQYVDFAVWQRERLSGATLAEQLRFWRDELTDLPGGDLPTDRPRPAERSYAGATVPITVAPTVLRALRTIADDSRATLFMAMVSVLSVVLGRWSGERDVVVGTPMAGRRRAELEPVVGFFVNTLPLRVRHTGHESFRELVRRVREVCVRAYAHQDVPFERIVHELASDRDASGQTTLARHWIVLHNTPPLRFDAPGLTAELEPALVGSVRCDLSFQLVPDQDGGIAGWLEFSTELFDRDTAERIVDALHTVLGAAVADPDRAVAELPVLPTASRQELLERHSGAGSVPTTEPGLVSWFEEQVDRTPNAPAVGGDGERLTYRELDERANRIAHLLRSAGTGPEDRVGVFLPPGADLLATVLGVLKAGAVYLPLDPGYPPGRVNLLVELGAPRLILTTPGLRARLDTGPPVRDLSAVSGQPTHRPAPARTWPDSVAYLLFTSGSTGRPKGVLGTHGGLVNRLAGMRDAFRVGAGDRVLQKAPLGFDVSLWELLLPVLTGAAVVPAGLDGHRDAEHLHELIDRERVTVCHFVPSMLREFLDGPHRAHDSVRLLLSGGEELPADLAATALRRLPNAELVNQYGPTETTVDVTATAVSAPVPARVPIGGMLPGVRGYVLDELCRPQPVGVAGELHLGGVQLARGYLGQPGRTAERFVPDPFVPGERLYATGDRVRWLPDGSLEFRGRLDEQVKIRGNRVEPGEVEAELAAHPGVERAVVVVDTGETGDPRLRGYFSGRVQPAELLNFLRQRLPGPAVPAHLTEVDRWPVGVHGKVDRAALPPPDGDRPAAGSTYVAPSTPVQHVVAGVFAELLHQERIGVNDSFLDLGGHSLLAIRALSRIRARLQVDLRVAQFFDSPDVASIAELIERQRRDGQVTPSAAPIPKVDRRRPRP
ncbi:hypothetical protein BLA60_15300 [Actinophytocola xinjiangensis]|uniref:Carrier domain-containing protein n=1 Tax=Actinophytocola xinjiangensis TaxID=485602 RepID=A0A7Z1AZC8_9PSEU|nr:non-ribosomal peptide synthetase [Actinophytocola xinjiangensis]OLF10547.1 hypothetical protein BLA60_15300 [Actinophytocola xinjiangensis]